jgi:hypothetical protein
MQIELLGGEAGGNRGEDLFCASAVKMGDKQEDPWPLIE